MDRIAELFEEYQVLAPGQWENKNGPKNWYALSNSEGIIAYFVKEKDAFMFRLDKINSILNS